MCSENYDDLWLDANWKRKTSPLKGLEYAGHVLVLKNWKNFEEFNFEHCRRKHETPYQWEETRRYQVKILSTASRNSNIILSQKTNPTNCSISYFSIHMAVL